MTDNFFAIGGDSLNAVELAVSLNIKPQTVYDNPFLYALANKIAEFTESEADGIANINELILQTEGGKIEKKYSSVLLTGATGFLGIHILKELIDAGLKVFCLVRNEKKLFSQIEYYFGALNTQNVEIIIGNIELENFGLEKETYLRLTEAVDAVYHVAANVHHAGDYSELKSTNVGGTENVIEFCLAADAVMHHTSTVSLHGAATVRQTYKNAKYDEHILNIGQYYCDNVYIHSKYRAEEAVISARLKGLKANIYRIGNLTWRKSDGRFQRNSFENGFLHRVRAMLKLGLYHENMDKYPMDLTAVDECACAFVKLSLLGCTNEIYHLFNHKYLKPRDMFNRLGVSYRQVSTTEMIETAFANTYDRDIHVYLFYMIISGRSQNVPMYNDFTLSRLSETGFEWSEPDEAYLRIFEDADNGHLNEFDISELKPMRKTGGALNPIQKLTLGVLKNAKPADSKIIKGCGKISEIIKELEERGLKKPLVITIPNAFGINGINAFLKSLPKNPVIYDSLSAEPTLKNTDDALKMYTENCCDCIIGIGGGSVLDTAKITALRAGNPGRVTDDICKLECVANFSVPLILCPTTAGTGSEVTFFAVVTDEEENKKRPFVSDKFLPDVIVLDPELTLTVPPKSTAYTGIDALSHAVESYISLFAPSFSEDMNMAPSVCKVIFDELEKAYFAPQNIEAREKLQLAAFDAGLSFRRIGTGYIHAIAHRLGEFCHIPHGLAIALCFSPVLRAYLPFAESKLSELALFCGLGSIDNSDAENADIFISNIDSLIKKLGISSEKISFNADNIDDIVLRAQEEAKIIGYPRPFSDEELKNIILSIFR